MIVTIGGIHQADWTYGGFHSHGTLKCMASMGKSQSKMDDDWGYPNDLGNPHVPS